MENLELNLRRIQMKLKMTSYVFIAAILITGIYLAATLWYIPTYVSPKKREQDDAMADHLATAATVLSEA